MASHETAPSVRRALPPLTSYRLYITLWSKFQIDSAFLMCAVVLGMAFLYGTLLSYDAIYVQSDIMLWHGVGQSISDGALLPHQVYDRGMLADYVADTYKGADLSHTFWFGYPPPVLWLLQGISMVPLYTAWIVCGALGLLAFCFCGWLVGLRGLSLAAFTLNPATVWFVGAINWVPTIVMGAFCIGLYCLHNKNWRLAGIALALCALKPQFALAAGFVLLLHWNWKTVCYLLLTGLGMVLATALVFGVDTWAASISTSNEFFAWARASNHVPHAYLSLYSAARSLGFGDATAMTVHTISILTLSILLISNRKDAIAVVLGLAVFPYNSADGLSLLMPVAAWIIVHVDKGKGLLLLALLILPIPWAHPSLNLWVFAIVFLWRSPLFKRSYAQRTFHKALSFF